MDTRFALPPEQFKLIERLKELLSELSDEGAVVAPVLRDGHPELDFYNLAGSDDLEPNDLELLQDCDRIISLKDMPDYGDGWSSLIIKPKSNG
jgi:hypothetical protein